MLRQSRYNVFVARRDGSALAYNSMSNAMAVMTADELALLRSVGDGGESKPSATVRGLLFGGYLVNDTDERAVLRAQYDAQRFDPATMTLTIAPTLQCNFGCDYCFQGVDKPAGKMSAATQEALVDFVASMSDGLQRLHVTWYGGEPLLARDVIESLSSRFVELCAARKISYSGFIVTNGYNLNLDVAKFLVDWKVTTAQITIDGARDYHDGRRTLLGGQPTFDRIARHILDVVEGSALRIACRINIDSRNAAEIPALLDLFDKMGLSRRKNFSVYFAPVEAITEGCHEIADACMTKQGYGALETELHGKAFELGLADLPYPRRFLGLCGAVKERGYVVVPNGDVHKCWDTVSVPHFRIGTVFEPDSLAMHPRAVEWRSWTPFDNETCRECKLLPVCAGACAHKFVNNDQTLGEAGSLPCPSWKFQLKERLVLMAIRAGAKREEFDSEATRTDPAELGPVDPTTQLPRHRIRYRLPVVEAV